MESTSTSKKLLKNVECRKNICNFFDTWVSHSRFGSQNNNFHEFSSSEVPTHTIYHFFHSFSPNSLEYIHYPITYSLYLAETVFLQFHFSPHPSSKPQKRFFFETLKKYPKIFTIKKNASSWHREYYVQDEHIQF